MDIKQGKILVVDDDPDLRDALKSTAELGGYEVTAASNGEEALRLIMAIRSVRAYFGFDHIGVLIAERVLHLIDDAGHEAIRVLAKIDRERIEGISQYPWKAKQPDPVRCGDALGGQLLLDPRAQVGPIAIPVILACEAKQAKPVQPHQT